MGRILTICALLALTLSGCRVLTDLRSERYDNHNSRGDAWLSDHSLPAEINVSGNWRSRDWGNTLLQQTGSRVQGYLGDYSVKGVVSGSKAYLILANGGWYYYSVILEMPAQNVLIGSYSKSVPYVRADSSDLRLERSGF